MLHMREARGQASRLTGKRQKTQEENSHEHYPGSDQDHQGGIFPPQTC